MKHENHTGSLTFTPTRTSDGKVIDTWVFNSPFSSARTNKEVQGVLDLLKADVAIFKEANAIRFKVRSPAFPGGALEGTDIEELRAQAEVIFQQQHDILLNCKWEDWFAVSVRKRDPMGREHVGINVGLEYKRVKRVTDAQGKTWAISSNGYAVEAPPPKRAAVDDPPPTSMSDLGLGREPGLELSFVRATPENKEALDAIIEKLKALHSVLSDFLQQDTIQVSLDKTAEQQLQLLIQS